MSATSTVLIVEDDPVFRRVMSFTVASFGLQVDTATDGLKGFERISQGGVDFLVTDLQMPTCTGLQLIEMLDDSETLTRPPTILCTAKGLELDTVELMREKELVAIMHKPFSPRKLGELIQHELAEMRPADAPASTTEASDSVGSIPVPSSIVAAPSTGGLGGSGLTPGFGVGASIDD